MEEEEKGVMSLEDKFDKIRLFVMQEDDLRYEIKLIVYFTHLRRH